MSGISQSAVYRSKKTGKHTCLAKIATYILIPVLVAAAILSSGASRAEDLRIGLASPPGSMDPHFENTIVNIAFASQVFDALIERDNNMQFVPGLAVSWKAVDENNWEIKLRQGVKFHDGTPFTADDVIFTFSRAGNVPGSPQNFLSYIAGKKLTKIDDYTIHIETDTPQPLLPADLALIAIVSKKHGEGAKTEDYNSGAATIGTGPYKFVEWIKGDQYVLERNPDYWGPKQQWDRVIFKPIGSGASRVAALLSGDVDVIDAVPTTDIPKLKMNDKISLFEAASTRLMYLTIDSSRDVSPYIKDLDGNPIVPNPLRMQEVRKAISKAIDRKAIKEKVMEGMAVPTGQIVPKGFFAFDEKLAIEPYDPEGAKALLAKMGLGKGFKATIQGPNDRYVNDAAVVQAIAQMLSRAGIQTSVETMPKAVFFSANAETPPRFSITFQGSSGNSGGPEEQLRGVLYTHNPQTGWGFVNDGRYSNARFDAKLEQAMSTVDRTKREEQLREATEIAVNDLGLIPLYHQVSVWATRKGLVYAPRSDEFTIAMAVSKSP